MGSGVVRAARQSYLVSTGCTKETRKTPPFKKKKNNEIPSANQCPGRVYGYPIDVESKLLICQSWVRDSALTTNQRRDQIYPQLLSFEKKHTFSQLAANAPIQSTHPTERVIEPSAYYSATNKSSANHRHAHGPPTIVSNDDTVETHKILLQVFRSCAACQLQGVWVYDSQTPA